jgi:NAD(P)-dependent dehydrogenase (short-subunit alcohol dehydrogenase family)
MTPASPAAGARGAVVFAGVGAGLGAALATRFVRAGYRVAGLARSAEFGRRLEASLSGEAGLYRHFNCDVTAPAAVADAIDAIAGDLGAPQVLIYNPMQLIVKPFQELGVEEFEAVWRVTCLGAVIVTQAVLPHVLGRGGGTIVFSGATASLRGGPGFASLAAAKFALRGLAQSLAREFGPRGVHVVHTILDGLIWSPQTRARFNADRDKCLEPEAIAETYLHIVGQAPSAWTHEIDLRPFHERF